MVKQSVSKLFLNKLGIFSLKMVNERQRELI